MFQQKYPMKRLASWWTWWEKRKSHIFRAFKPSLHTHYTLFEKMQMQDTELTTIVKKKRITHITLTYSSSVLLLPSHRRIILICCCTPLFNLLSLHFKIPHFLSKVNLHTPYHITASQMCIVLCARVHACQFFFQAFLEHPSTVTKGNVMYVLVLKRSFAHLFIVFFSCFKTVLFFGYRT